MSHEHDGLLDIQKGSYGSFPKPTPHGTWFDAVDSFFKISARGSSLETEVVAGITDFVASSYMLVLVPLMDRKGGVDIGVSMVGFAFGTFACSSALGLLSNLPIPSGPGLGSATYFAYSLALMHPAGDESTAPNTTYILSVCFAAGVLMTAVALLNLPMKIFDAMPASVKEAMPVGLGMLLALCGLQQIGLVVPSMETGTTMGDLFTNRVMLGMSAVFLMAFLEIKKFKAAFLIPMLLVTCAAWAFGYEPWPTGIMAMPPVGVQPLDFSLLGLPIIRPIISIYLICLLDIAGISYSAVRVAGLLNEDGSIPCAYWIFVCNGVATMLTAAMGSTPCIVFGEAFAGVLMGGKTGLTAIVMGLCFLCTIPFIPLMSAVPTFASAPVLVVLGVTLLGLLRHLNWDDHRTALPSFFTVSLMPFLHAVDLGIIAGLLAHSILVILGWLYSPLATIEELIHFVKGDNQPTTTFEQKLAALRAAIKERASTRDQLEELFNTYDQNKTGALTSDELAQLASSAGGGNMTPGELEATIEKLDPDNNGAVRFPQFSAWLQSPNDTA